MARKFIFRNKLLPSDGTLPIEKGGTAADNAIDAAANLGIVSKDLAGAPKGIVLVDKDGYLDKSFLPPNFVDPNVVCLYGPLRVPVGKTQRYKVTNYDSSTVYIATATNGSVAVSGEDVTFTASNTAGTGSITINGKTYTIAITNLLTTTPTISTPINDAVLTAISVTYNSSAYVPIDGVDYHQSSDWELSTNNTFTEIQYATYDDRVNKTSWTPPLLQETMDYYCRVRYRNEYGNISNWSAVKHITTGNDGEINFASQMIEPALTYKAPGCPSLYDSGTRLAITFSNNPAGVALYRDVNGKFIADGSIPRPVDLASNYAFAWSCAVSPNGKYLVTVSRDAVAAASNNAVSVYENVSGTWTYRKTTIFSGTDWYGHNLAVSDSSPHSSGRPLVIMSSIFYDDEGASVAGQQGCVDVQLLNADGSFTRLSKNAGSVTPPAYRVGSAITANGTLTAIMEGAIYDSNTYYNTEIDPVVKFYTITATGALTLSSIPAVALGPRVDSENRIFRAHRGCAFSPSGGFIAINAKYESVINGIRQYSGRTILLKRNALGNYEIYRDFDHRNFNTSSNPYSLVGSDMISVSDSPAILATPWGMDGKVGIQIFR